MARLGGDEFVILLAETDQGAGMLVTEKLRGLLLQAMQRENWPVTFSIGSINVLNPPESVDEMMNQADAMMYSVKQKGKN